MPHEGLVWRSIFRDSVSRCLGKSNFGKSQQPRFVPSQTVVVASVVIFFLFLSKNIIGTKNFPVLLNLWFYLFFEDLKNHVAR